METADLLFADREPQQLQSWRQLADHQYLFP